MNHATKHRKAVHAAGSQVVYAGLHTVTPFFQALLDDRHRIAGLLGGHVAEALHGFDVDLESELEQARRHLDEPPSSDIARAYRVALHHVGPVERFIPAGRRKTAEARARAEAHRHALAARHVREMWGKAESYLSRPELERMTRKLTKRAERGAINWRLASGAPDFDASITRRIERDRNASKGATRRAELAEESLLTWDRARQEHAA